MTAADETDIPIPESRVTFGQLKTAQALGDLDALESRGKPALRLHFTKGVEGGLATFSQAVERALVALAQA